MIKPMDLAAWLAYDREHPAPTFFARPAWALALADDNAARTPAPLLIERNGTSIILPTMQSRTRLRFRETTAFPLGGYTCFLKTTGGLAGEDDATAAMEELVRTVDSVRVTPWPLGPVPRPHGATTVIHETAVIDCSDGFDAALANVRGVTRRMAGQAERRGVICERGTIDELETYYDMLTEASKAWGLAKPVVSMGLLRAVLERGGDDAQLWFARADGIPIGGGIVFFGADELFFWSAAMRRDYGRLRPSNALNLALIRAACTRGVRWYNLGASEGLAGVARFKSDLGATGVPYAELVTRRAAFRLYVQVKDSMMMRKRSAAS